MNNPALFFLIFSYTRPPRWQTGYNMNKIFIVSFSFLIQTYHKIEKEKEKKKKEKKKS